MLSYQKQGSYIHFIMNTNHHMGLSDDKSAPTYTDEKGSSLDAEANRHDTEEGTVETTKRGLKARHAQMIALGGTIG